jgi:hypothetical protein
VGRNAQRRRAQRARGHVPPDLSASEGAAPPEIPVSVGEANDPSDCRGLVIEHIDGTEICPLGAACTGGDHTAAEECAGDPQSCEYCAERVCGGTQIEHAAGEDFECSHGSACKGPWWHERFESCEVVYNLEDDGHCPRGCF